MYLIFSLPKLADVKKLILKGLCSGLHKNWTFRDTSSWSCSRHQSYYLVVGFPAAANSFDILNVRKITEA